MKRWICNRLFLPFASVTLFASAEVEIVSPSEIPIVFGGTKDTVEIIFHNNSDQAVESDLQTRIYQATSATLVPLGEVKPWKKLQLLPGQKLIETVAFSFPEVRATAMFQIRWLDDNQKQIGITPVRVAPRDLLKQLTAFADEKPIGILDPENQIKPLLRKAKVEFRDLETGGGFDEFDGKLVVIGPFLSKESVPPNLRDRITNTTKEAKEPLAIVWMQPPGAKSEPLLPIYIVRENESTIVVMNSETVTNFPHSPKSQLNLVRAAQLALNPDFRLPQIEP